MFCYESCPSTCSELECDGEYGYYPNTSTIETEDGEVIVSMTCNEWQCTLP